MAASSSVVVKWNKAQYDIVLPASATVAHLKAEVARQTRVLPAQQKYAGCPALGKATDSDQVFSLSGIKAGQKLMMIGTAEEEAAAFQSQDVVLAAEKDKERAQRVERRQVHREAVATELVTACEEGRQTLIHAAIQRAMAYKAKVQHEVEEFGEPEDDPEATQQLDDLLHMCRAKLAELEAAERARLEAERRERERVWAERELQARLGREQAQLERERAMEVDPEAKCDFTFACYSAGQVGGRPEVEVSDQVVLPAQALERVVALRIPMPLVLQASNPSSSSSSSSSSPSPPSLPDATEMGGAAEEAAQPWQITHCGVFDFTAPEGMAFMPTGMMRKLRLSEGDCCRFRTHVLPPGEYAQLQPLSDAWTRVPEKEACLEHALRKYQTLTVGDVIAITGPHDRNLYRFRCLQTRPSPAISVLNTDLTLDVTAPGVSPVLGEELGEEDWVRALAQQEAAGSDPTPAAVADLPLGSTVEGAVAAGCSQYYTLTVGPLGAGHPEGTVGLHVTVKRLTGDPDLYVSTRNRQPSRDDNEWARNEAVGDKTLFVPLPVPEQLFIAIHAYRVEARYSISTRAGERGIGQRLDTADAEPMAETTLCPNCQRRVPTAAFVLHSAQCARRNVRCAQCGAVQEVGPAHEKHMYAVHSPVACRCGAQLEPEAMALHRQFECKYRLLPCVYCPLQISAEDRPQHLSDCGNRSVRCRLCPATFVRWRLKTHLGEAHQLDVEGPLTDYFEPV